MLVVVLNMPEHSSFQDMLFPMLFISKYAKSYASIRSRCVLIFLLKKKMDISLHVSRSTPVAQLAPRNLLTRWDVSSIPANGIFLTKN